MFFNRSKNRSKSTFVPKYPIGKKVYVYHNCRQKDIYEISKMTIERIDGEICFRLSDDGSSVYEYVIVKYGERIPFNGWWIKDIEEKYVNVDKDELLKVLIENNKHMVQ